MDLSTDITRKILHSPFTFNHIISVWYGSDNPSTGARLPELKFCQGRLVALNKPVVSPTCLSFSIRIMKIKNSFSLMSCGED